MTRNEPDEKTDDAPEKSVEPAGEAPSLLQPVTDETRRLARQLLRAARDAALGVIRPEDGFPAVSRVLIASDFSGRPVVLVSALSLHAGALAADLRCSLLVGRMGKGDPLTHPRMTVFARAEAITRDSEDGKAVRQRFLARHPKAALYVDFPDFRFLRLEPVDASLNGGFGRAFALEASDLRDNHDADLPASALRALDHMNEDHADAIDHLAALNGADGSGWRIATIDRRGFEILRGDQLARIEFELDPADEGGYRKAFVDLMRPGPQAGGKAE